MRWFKHKVGSHDDPDIYGAMEKFGAIGYSIFFIILEIFADEYHHKVGKEVTFNQTLLCQKLHCRWTTVELVLNYYQTLNRLKYRTNGSNILIEIPDFDKVMDNWSKRNIPHNSVVTTEQLPNHIRYKNKEEDIKKENIQKNSARIKIEVREILEFLNIKTGKKYTNGDFIKARLNDGGTIEQCKQIILNKLNDDHFLKDNNKFMRPSTLFAKSHWDEYLNDIPISPHKPQLYKSLLTGKMLTREEYLKEETRLNKEQGENHD